MKNGTLKYRVEQLEKQIGKIDDKMDIIMENHLPHLQQAIERNNIRITIATAINLGAIILTAVLLKYL